MAGFGGFGGFDDSVAAHGGGAGAGVGASSTLEASHAATAAAAAAGAAGDAEQAAGAAAVAAGGGVANWVTAAVVQVHDALAQPHDDETLAKSQYKYMATQFDAKDDDAMRLHTDLEHARYPINYQHPEFKARPILSQAVKRGCYNCCVLLVSHYGADVNVQAKDRCSPLHYAAHHGHEDIAKFLLGAGADPALVNKYGETARMVARSRGHVAVVSLIDASISEAEQGGAQARPPAKPPDYVWVPSDDEGDEAGGGAGDGAGEEGNAAAGGDDVAAAAVTATAVPLVVPKALLLCVTHSKSGSLSADTTFRVTREGASIGRTSDCDVRVAAPRVSKSHAVIMFQQSWGFYIADCGSNNGTTLEGVRLSKARKSSGWVYLRDGSSLSIAEDTTFHVAFDLADSGEAAGAAAGAATPARPPRRRNKRRHDDANPATTKTNTSMLGAPASASSSAAPSAAATAADASKYESNLKRQRGGRGGGRYRDRAAERRARHPGHDDTEFMTEEARAASDARHWVPQDSSQPLPGSHKGAQLLKRMGWKAGEGLGKHGDGRVEPVPLIANQGRGGLGAGSTLEGAQVTAAATAAVLANGSAVKRTRAKAARRRDISEMTVQRYRQVAQQDDQAGQGEET